MGCGLGHVTHFQVVTPTLHFCNGYSHLVHIWVTASGQGIIITQKWAWLVLRDQLLYFGTPV